MTIDRRRIRLPGLKRSAQKMEEVQKDISDSARLITAMGGSVKALDACFRKLKGKRPIKRTDLSDFSRLASDLPYGNDCDYGALLLESESDRRVGDDRATLLDAALERAKYCASTATAGGEGLARMIHVRRLETKLAEQAGGGQAATRSEST